LTLRISIELNLLAWFIGLLIYLHVAYMQGLQSLFTSSKQKHSNSRLNNNNFSQIICDIKMSRVYLKPLSLDQGWMTQIKATFWYASWQEYYRRQAMHDEVAFSGDQGMH
ncbi:hypothetical protein ACJX0J_016804, partial [Zea mays]